MNGAIGTIAVSYTGAMRLFLFGLSAASVWLSRDRAIGAKEVAGSSMLRGGNPTEQSLDYLHRLFPQIPAPVHLSLPTHPPRPSAEVIGHRSTFKYVGKPYVRIADGVFAACPELCFVQLARELSFAELLKAGNALCSRYCVSPASRHGLVGRDPLTSPKRILRSIEKNPGLPGLKLARSVAVHLCAQAASPPEAFLASVLGLPYRHGGFALDGAVLNRPLTLGAKARAIAGSKVLIPDVLYPEARLILEYDSNSEHLTAAQVTRDSVKRLAYEADGYRVITVTARQLGNRVHMRSVAKRVARCLRRRIRPQGESFEEKHRQLLTAGWSIDGYFDSQWLLGERGCTGGALGESTLMSESFALPLPSTVMAPGGRAVGACRRGGCY